jgi:hypothetical protein
VKVTLSRRVTLSVSRSLPFSETLDVEVLWSLACTTTTRLRRSLLGLGIFTSRSLKRLTPPATLCGNPHDSRAPRHSVASSNWPTKPP